MYCCSFNLAILRVNFTCSFLRIWFQFVLFCCAKSSVTVFSSYITVRKRWREEMKGMCRHRWDLVRIIIDLCHPGLRMSRGPYQLLVREMEEREGWTQNPLQSWSSHTHSIIKWKISAVGSEAKLPSVFVSEIWCEIDTLERVLGN